MSKNFKGWENYKPKTYGEMKGMDVKTKYGNKKTEVDGILFDSKKEANRYRELKIMEKAGVIDHFNRQVTYSIEVNGILICKYIADFAYYEAGKGERIIEDVKGYKTREYQLKKKMMLAIYGIKIKEI